MQEASLLTIERQSPLFHALERYFVPFLALNSVDEDARAAFIEAFNQSVSEMEGSEIDLIFLAETLGVDNEFSITLFCFIFSWIENQDLENFPLLKADTVIRLDSSDLDLMIDIFFYKLRLQYIVSRFEAPIEFFVIGDTIETKLYYELSSTMRTAASQKKVIFIQQTINPDTELGSYIAQQAQRDDTLIFCLRR